MTARWKYPLEMCSECIQRRACEPNICCGERRAALTRAVLVVQSVGRTGMLLPQLQPVLGVGEDPELC